MKIPIIKTNNTISKQLSKVKSEYNEVLIELLFDSREKQLQLESLDLLTATLNLVQMLNIPQDVINEWEDKMRGYEVEKGYEIKEWVTID